MKREKRGEGSEEGEEKRRRLTNRRDKDAGVERMIPQKAGLSETEANSLLI